MQSVPPVGKLKWQESVDKCWQEKMSKVTFKGREFHAKVLRMCEIFPGLDVYSMQKH